MKIGNVVNCSCIFIEYSIQNKQNIDCYSRIARASLQRNATRPPATDHSKIPQEHCEQNIRTLHCYSTPKHVYDIYTDSGIRCFYLWNNHETAYKGIYVLVPSN